MALIEIDGLPFLNMVDLSVAMLNNQMVPQFLSKTQMMNLTSEDFQPWKILRRRLCWPDLQLRLRHFRDTLNWNLVDFTPLQVELKAIEV